MSQFLVTELSGGSTWASRRKRTYLEAIRSRYRKARRADKGRILDEFCSVCGYQRKYVIRLLGRKPAKSTRRPGQTFTMQSTCIADGIAQAMDCNRSDVE